MPRQPDKRTRIMTDEELAEVALGISHQCCECKKLKDVGSDWLYHTIDDDGNNERWTCLECWRERNNFEEKYQPHLKK